MTEKKHVSNEERLECQPTIDVIGDIKPNSKFVLKINLLPQNQIGDKHGSVFYIDVYVVKPPVIKIDGDDPFRGARGVINVQSNWVIVPCFFSCTVLPDAAPGTQVEFMATFYHKGEFSGSARKILKIQ